MGEKVGQVARGRANWAVLFAQDQVQADGHWARAARLSRRTIAELPFVCLLARLRLDTRTPVGWLAAGASGRTGCSWLTSCKKKLSVRHCFCSFPLFAPSGRPATREPSEKFFAFYPARAGHFLLPSSAATMTPVNMERGSFIIYANQLAS